MDIPSNSQEVKMQNADYNNTNSCVDDITEITDWDVEKDNIQNDATSKSNSDYVYSSNAESTDNETNDNNNEVNNLHSEVNDGIRPLGEVNNTHFVGKCSRKRKVEKYLQRNAGQAYTTLNGKCKKACQMKLLTKCGNICKTKIKEEDRKQIFKEYWNLGSRDKGQRLFVVWCFRVHYRTQKTCG